MKAIDYLYQSMPPALKGQLTPEQIGIYEVAARTQTLALFASNEDLRDKALVPIQAAVKRSGLPEGVYRTLKQLLEKDGVDQQQIQTAVGELHSDMKLFLGSGNHR